MRSEECGVRLHSWVRGRGGTVVRDYTRGARLYSGYEIILGGAVVRGYGGARLLRRWRSALRVISSPPELGGEPGRAGWSERAHRPPRPLTPPNSGGEIITTVGCPDASHAVRRGDAWRAATRCLACGVVMPGAIKREASARDLGDIPSGLARHCDRIRVVDSRTCPASRSYQSRGWSCLPGIAIVSESWVVVFARYAIVGDPGAVMIVISH